MFSKDTPVREVMSSPPRCIYADETLSRIDAIFKLEDYHHLLVVDDNGDIIGIVSHEDFKYALEQLSKNTSGKTFSKQILNHWTAERIMTQHPTCLHIGDTVGMAASYFMKNEFHALPILDESQQLVGIVTSHDLLKYAYQ